MRIALLGGTGDIGEALALRWAYHTDHDLVIGSRDAARAEEAAASYASTIEDCGMETTVSGSVNADAVDGARVVVLAVPPYYVTDTIESVKASLTDNSVLISPAVGISRDEDGFHYSPPETGSVTALVADVAPANVPVVGAFHNLAAGRLGDLDAELDIDTVVLGDDDEAKGTVCRLVNDIPGLRPLDGGGLANASEVEAITPLLINLAQKNDGMQDLGVTFH